MVTFEKCLIFKIVKFWTFVDLSNWKYSNIWLFTEWVNRRNLGNYLIFLIWNFWGWELEFQRENMRIDEMTNNAEYRMDKQNQNLPIFGI